MKKVIRKVTKEERKGNLNEPLVVIEQDSVLTKKELYLIHSTKQQRIPLSQ